MEQADQFAYAINTFFILICGALVMFMAAGFAMLEAGTVRSKSVAVILVKNISIYAIAGLMFMVVGFNLMYADVAASGGWYGVPALWYPHNSPEDTYADAARWFFQMVFVATAASIVSGALAERIKIMPFLFFCMVLTGLIYPIVGAWTWGGGWLAGLGFSDFAGSTIVHSVGGWAAVTGALLLGPRRGRFSPKRNEALQPSSLPLVTLGTFILWFGWFGFNGGSQLAISSIDDARIVAEIFANTNIAASAGAVATVVFFLFKERRIHVPMALNGALAGLVAITADPVHPDPYQAVLIGTVGALLMIGAALLLEKLKVDDVVGAIPVHLVGGIWGTLIVPLSNPDATLVGQLSGIGAVAVFVAATSFIVWELLRRTVGIRIHWSEETRGSDVAELGVKAYNLH